jgi:hypothetical protein
MTVLAETHDSLQGEWSALESHWQSVSAQWRDNVAARFEKQFWQPMEDSIPQLLRTIDEVEETFRQAFRSLED